MNRNFLKGSGKKGEKNGIDFDAYEPDVGERFCSKEKLQEEKCYIAYKQQERSNDVISTVEKDRVFKEWNNDATFVPSKRKRKRKDISDEESDEESEWDYTYPDTESESEYESEYETD